MSGILIVMVVIMTAILVGMVGFMVWFLRQLHQRNGTVVDFRQIPSIPHRRCPRCGAQMKRGFAASSSGIFWHSAGQVSGGLSNTVLGTLPNTMSLGLKLRENLAWHCDACTSLLVDFSRIVRT